jgi:hypothetical protein
MGTYTSELSMPLVGLDAGTVLAAVQDALAGDERVERIDHLPPDRPSRDPLQHVTATVRFTAASDADAARAAQELHDRALHDVLAAAPADAGWTSSFRDPEEARD